MDDERDWFLTPEERGNPDSAINRRVPDGTAWTNGNAVTPLVHGRVYLKRLVGCLRELRSGDRMWFTDWRGDADELLTPDGTGSASRPRRTGLPRRPGPRAPVALAQQVAIQLPARTIKLADLVNEVGGDAFCSTSGCGGPARITRSWSSSATPGRRSTTSRSSVASTCVHGRGDDRAHRGDPQPEAMDKPTARRRPGTTSRPRCAARPIGDIATTFRERWNDPTPLDRRNPWRPGCRHAPGSSRAARAAAAARRRPAAGGPPRGAGPAHLPGQATPRIPSRPQGERSIAREYHKAFERARRLIYVEDQYLWSAEVAELYAEALRAHPDLHVIVVVPRLPDRNGSVCGPAHRIGQLEVLHEAARGRRRPDRRLRPRERARHADLRPREGRASIDDVLAAVGSDNMNRRSWTHDSECSLAVLDEERDEREPADPAGLGDGARAFARRLRLELCASTSASTATTACSTPLGGLRPFARSAAALEAWHRGGGVGPRPAGRLRPHRLRELHPWEIWGGAAVPDAARP